MENKNIMKTTYIFTALFLLLTVFFSYYIGVTSKSQMKNPYNKLHDKLSESVVRGDILDRDGVLLATTKENDGKEYRYYPNDTLFCHAVGSTIVGKYGLELIYNYELLTSDISNMTKFSNDLKGNKDIGNTLKTTYSFELQKAASEALKDYKGSVIIMDSENGEVLSMFSNPSYNPNMTEKEWEEVSKSEDSVILNRATQGLYTPGSIFKIFTLSEYLLEFPNNDYTYKCNGYINIAGQNISCSNKAAHGNVDLVESFAHSCNSSFVNMGLQLSVTKFNQSAKKWLFNTELPIEYPYKKSSLNISDTTDEFLLAQTMFGQGETLVTPMHMALIVSAIANDGVLVKPKFVTSIENAYGRNIKNFKSEEYGRLFSKELAAKMQENMRAVVEGGTATRLNDFNNLIVSGKTGTAEINNGKNINSWFVGYAEKKDKKYTVVVVCENVDANTSPVIPVTEELLKTLDK